jgi:hypothetical protein
MLDRLALMLRWLRAVCRLRRDRALENLALRVIGWQLVIRHPEGSLKPSYDVSGRQFESSQARWSTFDIDLCQASRYSSEQ